MTEYLQLIRRTARFLLATVLWLHAFFLLGLDLPSARPVATALRLQVGETNVLILLACASVLASYGFKNIFVDCLYIYTFPFIFTYYVARASFQTLAVVYRAFLKDEEEEPITSKSLRVGSTEKAEQPNSPRGTTVKGVLLLVVRTSASLPRNPVSEARLAYMFRFSFFCSRESLGAPQEQAEPLPRSRAAFSGGPSKA